MRANNPNDDPDVIGWVIVGLIFITGIGVFIGQLYFYLRDNIWHSVSVITLLQWFDLKWAHNPESWTGLWNVMDFMPVSITLIILGIIIVKVG